jgi:hypothetical protein
MRRRIHVCHIRRRIHGDVRRRKGENWRLTR